MIRKGAKHRITLIALGRVNMTRRFTALLILLWSLLSPLKGDRNATRHVKGRVPHMAMASSNALSQYGVDLPSFAFDFSEYFVSATITRQRYLTMVLIGHRIIYEDYPIEAISTDYEIMEHWNQATKFWAKPMKYNVRTKLQQMFCVVRNHNDQNRNPYHVPATWFRVSSKSLNESGIHSNFNRHIEMLRCPLTNIQQGKSYSLDVDIYRKENGPKNGNTNTLVISFSVPVEKSYRGYPSIPQFQVSSILPITTADKRNELSQASAIDRLDSTVRLPATTTKESTSAVSSTTPPVSSPPSIPSSSTTQALKTVAIIACIPGIRIAHIKRSETGLAMLLEFVAHLFQQGIDQVMLGVVVSSTSPYFLTAKLMFQSLYPPDAVILVPTGMMEFDDAAGLPGVQLTDNFADVFFLNHCLYLLKGKEFGGTSSPHTNGGPKFMLIMRANQFLVSPTAAAASTTTNPSNEPPTLKRLLTTALTEKWSLGVETTASVSGAFLGNAATPTIPGVSSSSSSTHHKDRKSASASRFNSHHHHHQQQQPLKQTQTDTSSTTNRDRPPLRQLAVDESSPSSSKNTKSRPSLSRLCSIRLLSPHNGNVSSVSSAYQYHFIADPMTVFHDNGPGHFTFTKDFFQESVPRTMSTTTSSSSSSSTLFPWMVSLINIDRAIAIDVQSTEELLHHYETAGAPTHASKTQQQQQRTTKQRNSAIFSDLPAAHAVVYPVCVPLTGVADHIEHGILTATQLQVNTYVPPAYTSDTLIDLPARTAAAALDTTSGTTLEDVQEQTHHLYRQIHRALQVACQRPHLLSANQRSVPQDTPGTNATHLQQQQQEQILHRLLQQLCTTNLKPSTTPSLLTMHDLIQQLQLQHTTHDTAAPAAVAGKSRKDITPPFWQLCNTAHLSEILRKVFLS